jgi:hypothetical protein
MRRGDDARLRTQPDAALCPHRAQGNRIVHQSGGFMGKIGYRTRTLVARLLAVTGLVAAAALTPLAAAAPAQAATCNGRADSASASVGRTTFTWDLCSDLTVQIWSGTHHDTNCDGRSAYVSFGTQMYLPGPGTWVGISGSSSYKADTGCGNWSTYPRITLPNRLSSPGGDCRTCQHRLRISIWACNSTTCSSTTTAYRTYYYSQA